jgi:hypothetical protein
MNNQFLRVMRDVLVALVLISMNALPVFAQADKYSEPDVSQIRKVQILFASNRRWENGKVAKNKCCEKGAEVLGIRTLEKEKPFKSRREVQKAYAMKPLPHERLRWKLKTAKITDTQIVKSAEEQKPTEQFTTGELLKSEERFVLEGKSTVAKSGQPYLVFVKQGSFRSADDSSGLTATEPFSGSPIPIMDADWCSRGNVIGPRTYGIDRMYMTNSVYFGEYALGLACKIAGREHVQLWAHSMGTDGLAQALLRIYLRESSASPNAPLEQFARADLFCPDIQALTLVNNYMEPLDALIPAYKKVVYITMDVPLFGSKYWQGGEDRAGNSYPKYKETIVVRFNEGDAGSVRHSNPAWLRDDMAFFGDEIAEQLTKGQVPETIRLRGNWKLVLDRKHTRPECPVYILKKTKKSS